MTYKVKRELSNQCVCDMKRLAPVWQNIPDFLSYKIESIQKRAMRIIFPLMSYNEALNALNLTVLSDSRAHLCQVYIARLRNENHPLHFMLPKQEEAVHNYNLRSGISRSTRPTCRTKRTQEFVTHKYIVACTIIFSSTYWIYCIIF